MSVFYWYRAHYEYILLAQSPLWVYPTVTEPTMSVSYCYRAHYEYILLIQNLLWVYPTDTEPTTIFWLSAICFTPVDTPADLLPPWHLQMFRAPSYTFISQNLPFKKKILAHLLHCSNFVVSKCGQKRLFYYFDLCNSLVRHKSTTALPSWKHQFP